MADMKGITCCGDCFYYDWKKKRCKRGASQDTDPKTPFFADCPLPSVEPERPKGRWIKEHLVGCEPYYLCSLCGKLHDQDYNFCNNCGADMRGKSDE